MKDKIVIILILLIFVIALVFSSNYISKKEDKVEIRNTTSNVGSSKVIEVYSNNFNEEVLQSEKKVLIDFYATWCEPCKKLSPIIDEVADENEDIKFVRIDVDKNTDIASDYDIQYMPTLVLISDGEVIDRSIGLIDKDTLLNFLGGK